MDLSQKKRRALDRLASCPGVVVALSGGVDSAVLLALSLEALGPGRVLAATGVSPSLARSDLADALRVAGFLGARHKAVRTFEAESPGYRANDGLRCFHCRDELFSRLRAVAREEGFGDIAYGAIADDLADDRPGMRAALRHGVIAPLLEAGVIKAEVRALAEAAGLPVGDKPASACLSSRIPVGTEVTPERLAQVELAEAALASLGFRQFRVRHHGEIARLEFDAEGNLRLADPKLRAEVAAQVRRAGFRYVAVDLDGYRAAGLAVVPGPRRAGGDPMRESGQ